MGIGVWHLVSGAIFFETMKWRCGILSIYYWYRFCSKWAGHIFRHSAVGVVSNMAACCLCAADYRFSHVTYLGFFFYDLKKRDASFSKAMCPFFSTHQHFLTFSSISCIFMYSHVVSFSHPLNSFELFSCITE